LHAALDPLWMREGKGKEEPGRTPEELPPKEENVSNETEVPRSTAPAQAVLGRRDVADFIGAVLADSPATFGENGLKRPKFA